jgi:hypothetical protein
MVRQNRTTAAVVISLALTSSLAPIASADPAPLARAEAAIAAAQPSPPVRPNPDEQTANAAATYSGPCSEVCSGGAASYGSPTYPSVHRHPVAARLRSGPGIRAFSAAFTPPRVVRLATHGSGFAWRDAGIGAGAALLLLAIGLTGARAATSSRKRHNRDRRAIVTS